MTLSSVLTNVATALQGAGLTVYHGGQITDEMLDNLPDEFIVLHVITDSSIRDFDGEAYSGLTIQASVAAQTLGRAYQLVDTITGTLTAWERVRTVSGGRDGNHILVSADYERIH